MDCAWFLSQLHHTFIARTNPKTLKGLARALSESALQWPNNMPLRVQPTMQELTDAIRSLANGKTVGPDGVPVELFKIALNGGPAPCRRLLDGGGARCRSSGKIPSSWISTKRRIGQSAATTRGHLAGSARRLNTAEDHRSPPQRVLRARGDPAGGTEWFPTEPFYHRYDVCDSSVTVARAEETNSALCMLCRPYQSVRLRRSNPLLNSTRPFWRAT